VIFIVHGIFVGLLMITGGLETDESLSCHLLGAVLLWFMSHDLLLLEVPIVGN